MGKIELLLFQSNAWIAGFERKFNKNDAGEKLHRQLSKSAESMFPSAG
jgi:hypothetical protein